MRHSAKANWDPECRVRSGSCPSRPSAASATYFSATRVCTLDRGMGCISAEVGVPGSSTAALERAAWAAELVVGMNLDGVPLAREDNDEPLDDDVRDATPP